MKIKYIANMIIPNESAHCFQICKMCEMFSEAGADIELLISHVKSNIKQDVFEYYELKNKYKIRKVFSINLVRFLKPIKSKYVRWMAFYLKKWSFLFSLLMINIDKDTIIYTREQEIAWMFKMRGYKTVYECHSALKRKRLFLKNVDYMVVTSVHNKNYFRDKNIYNKEILVVPNGVDLDVFDINVSKNDAAELLDLNEEVIKIINNNIIITYTGNLMTKGISKGVEYIIKALNNLDDNIYLFAVGGKYKHIEKFKDMAKKMNVEKRVKFFSRQTQRHLAYFQKISDVLLVPRPQPGSFESFMSPLKMFEYMASKKPIISSELEKLKPILNEDNCLFFKPGDSSDMADKIIKVLDDEILRKKITNQAYEDVKQYVWSKRAEKILKHIS